MYDFITIDFETANNNLDSACSVGIVAVKDLEIVEKEYFLIKPPTDRFRGENTEIHGICFEDVKDCEQFPCVFEKIKNYFNGDNMVIAHNAQFDMSVLYSLLKTYNLASVDFQYVDSIKISTKKSRGTGSSLEEKAKHFGIEMGRHHNALDDAITCAKIVICSVQNSRYKTLDRYLNAFTSIKVRRFSELKPTKSFGGGRFPSVNASEIAATSTDFDTSHPLYSKSCVVTGEFETMSRKTAMQKIIDVGGMVKGSVSGKTDYVIVGVQDLKIVGADGVSSKERKARELASNGADIKILNEADFINLLQ